MCLDKACGIDVHRDMFVASIVDQEDTVLQESFCTTGEGMYRLRDWILENGCRDVAFESTGIYWRPLYNVLCDSFNVSVANPGKIRKPSLNKFKKTDKVDSKWIAKLCLSGMIHQSRVFLGDQYNLRELTRQREQMVRAVAQFKNRANRVCEACCVKIGNVLSDMFGINGRRMLMDLVKGKCVDEILKGITNKRIKKKEEALRQALSTGLDETSRLLLKNCLYWIKSFEEGICNLDAEIRRKLQGREVDLRCIMSIPGFQFVSSATVLAEIGDARDFDTSEQLASWCGLVPRLYQSGNKQVNGRITKQGSKYLRRMLIQVAHVIGKMDNNLSKFFHRIKDKKGSKKAAVALARKLVTIIHHLLVNKEKYEEPEVKPKKVVIPRMQETHPIPSIEEMIALIKETGRIVSEMPDLSVQEPTVKKRERKSRSAGGT